MSQGVKGVMEYAPVIAPSAQDSFVFGHSVPTASAVGPFLQVFVFFFFVLGFLKSQNIGLVAKYFLACSSQFIQSLL